MSGNSTAPVPGYKRQAQRRARITLVSISGFLGIALVIALAFSQGWMGSAGSGSASSATACSPRTLPPPQRVSVNVYNATDQNGLAKAVARGLADQGFRIVEVANDSSESTVTGSAEVRYGTAGADNAQAVAARVSGATFRKDNREDVMVDLVIGPRYRRMIVPTTPAC